jgi:hypothetical protein
MKRIDPSFLRNSLKEKRNNSGFREPYSRTKHLFTVSKPIQDTPHPPRRKFL